MKKHNKYVVGLTIALSLFPVGLDSTIVNVALVPISKALKTDFNTIQWIAIGYLLANAAVVPLSGYLGNRFGNKRLFIGSLAIFTLMSFLCGIAPDEGWLIGLRVLQGIGGGMLIPLGTAMALEPFAKAERAKAMGLVGIPILLAPVLGPIIGGAIIDNWNWQWIFYVNVPICLLAIWLSGRILPTDEVKIEKAKENFDYLGLALSTLGVVLVVYAFKLVSDRNPATKSALNPQGDIYGWSYWLVWVLLGSGVALLVGFAINALRFSRDPVLDLRLFKRLEFSLGNLVIWIGSIVSFGVMALIPQFLQSIRQPNLSAVDTGLALMPLGLGAIIGMVLGGGLYRKIGARPLVVVGAGLFAFSFWQLGNLTPTTSGGDIWLWVFTLGLSMMLTILPSQTLALGGLKGEALNKASSLVNCSKLLAASIGSAVLVTFEIQQITAHANQLKAEAMQNVAAGGTLSDLAARAGTSGLNEVFTVLIYISLALAVIGLALPGRQVETVETEEGEEAETHQMIAV